MTGGGEVDALLLVSFGGPEGPDDVLPFLRNVTAGRAIPPARIEAVAEQYRMFGGRSPLNDQNRALAAALRASLPELPVYWGNRNWAPYLTDTVAEMSAAGVRRAACFVTSAFASHSGCRQYREDLAGALAALPAGTQRPELVKLRLFFDHPGFVEPMIDHCLAALADLPVKARADAHLLFTAHSLPLSQSAASGPHGDAYPRQLRAVADLIAAGVERRTGVRHPVEIVFCSRSGPPSVSWLEPDVGDRLAELAAAGAAGAVLVPIGFVSDHMEVVHDLDVVALRRARGLGLPATRAGTVGTDPRFVAMVRELVDELRDPTLPRRSLSVLGPWTDVCAPHCCQPPGIGRQPPGSGLVPETAILMGDGATMTGRRGEKG
ncbi:Ferrochelatase [Frankia canadensis]|uniref:Coproporphyrin III ferrochelatase n=1 Tax=Frankia canadensis TaxID=1836972 RepID=A0A2I2KPG0_9ACTN|nr:ferrochelatase [Frankia canadensis]SNQ47558.1 Ferrochelatase [Frankia canadensis]SOU54848.1 Ferrochelatase [Frankia canadensis]